MQETHEEFEIPEGAYAETFARRNELISTLLQDRGVVRLITAPHGFGKTALAAEYAERLFPDGQIVWVEGSSPDFLACLDDGVLLGTEGPSGHVPGLYVLDALPWLHEERAETLARKLDALLYRGAEVLVTALPSTDCLRCFEPDCVLVRAVELLVTEQECQSLCTRTCGQDPMAEAARMWRRANGSFMGRVPGVCWGHEGQQDVRSCLRAFFDESLPLPLFHSALCMLMLGHGSVEDLHDLDAEPDAAYAQLLMCEYPFFGLEANLLEFGAPAISPSLLAEALSGNELLSQVCAGSVPLAERVLGVLLNRGEMRRSEEVLEAFCSDRHCASWLESRGWDLLDCGQFDVLETLFARAPVSLVAHTARLQVLRAWACGLQGEELEARHFARQVLADASHEPESSAAVEKLMAYLALVAFDGGGGSVHGKGSYGGDGTIGMPEEFLANVIDVCSELEVARALSPDASSQRAQLDKLRESAEQKRVDALERLFTQHHERMWASAPYRIALHVLHFVDDPRLRTLAQDLGCDIVMAIRRDGLRRYSEALLVRDLWKGGYFGLHGPAGSQRDAVLLDQAARTLRLFARRRGDVHPYIPWELRGDGLADGVRIQTPRSAPDDVDMMHVRLFGSFEVSVGERLVKESEFRRKSRVLFTVLAVNQGRDVSRDFLLEQLWSGLSRPRALDNFYTVWSNIVAAVGEGPYLERGGDFCRLDMRYVVSDVDEFERLTRQLLVSQLDASELLDMYAHIESLYRGSLVPSEVDNHFIEAQRTRYNELFVDAMLSAVACALNVSDVRLALWFARNAMEADDRREDVYYALMRAQAAAGQRCSAIGTYVQCQQFLRDELGLDPSHETKEFYDKLITTDPGLLRLDEGMFKR